MQEIYQQTPLVTELEQPHNIDLSPDLTTDQEAYVSSKPKAGLSKLVIASAAALVLVLVGGVALVFILSSHSPTKGVASYEPTSQPKTLPTASGKLQLQNVLVNGQLDVNNGLVLQPSSQPTNPTLGQLYFDNVSNQPYYYNGSAFISLGQAAGGTIAGATSQVSLGQGLTLQGVTLTSTGVIDLSGTPNQINVSRPFGSIVLSLPTNISIAGSFSAASLSGDGSDITNITAAALPSDVAYTDHNDQTITGERQVFRNSIDDPSGFSIQNASGSTELSVDTQHNLITTTDLLPAVPGVITPGSIGATIDPSTYAGEDVGTPIAVGPDGFARFAYYNYDTDTGNNVLDYARCTNASCSSPVITVAAGNNGTSIYPEHVSMAIGPDGFARIAYLDSDTGYLMLVRCTDENCDTNIITTVDVNDDYGAYYGVTIDIGQDGFPKIAYESYPSSGPFANSYTATYADCTDADCTSPSITYIANTYGYYPGVNMALGSDGLPRITYEDGTDYNFKMARCTDITCSSPAITTIDSGGSSTYPGYEGNSIQIGTDGFPRIVYNDDYNHLYYVQCLDANCDQNNSTQLSASSYTDYVGNSLAINPDGSASITYSDDTNYYLQYIHCTAADCSTHTNLTLDQTQYAAGHGLSLVTAPNNSLMVAYAYENGLKYLKLGDPDGATTNTGTNIGGSNDRFGSIYSTGADTQKLVVEGSAGSGNLLQLESDGTSVATVSNSGATTFKNATNSTNAFQIQNANGNNILNVDSSNNNVTIGGAVLPLGTTSTGYQPYSVAVSGNYAYVVNYNGNNLQIFDVSDPTSPNLLSTVGTGTTPFAVAVSGNYAYVTNYNSDTLQIFDVSDPTNPSSISTINTGGTPFGLTVSGNYAYVANFTSSTLQIFDVSDPANPSLISTTSTSAGNNPYSVSVSGNYAYVTNYNSNTLQIFDVSDPTNPSLLSTIGTGYDPTSVAVSGNYAYVTNLYSYTLQIFDVSDPTNPSLLSTINTGFEPTSVAVSGNYAYVTNLYSYTLQIFDVSDPTNPSLLSTINTGFEPTSVAVSGNYAYVTNSYSNTLQIFDASPPNAATFQVEDPSGASALAVNTETQSVGIGTNSPASALQLASDAGTAVSGISFGSAADVSLYRSGPGELTLDGSLTVTDSLFLAGSVTVTGGLHVLSGGGLDTFDAGTNVLPDPTFDIPANDIGRGSGTVQQVTGQAGTATGRAMKITPNNSWTTVHENCILGDTNATYTMSFLAWTDGGSEPVSLLDGPYNEFSEVTVSGTTPHRYAVSFVNPSSGCNSFEVGPYYGTTPVYIADWQVEAGSQFTGFIYGDAGPGYSWEGAPNNSASDREGMINIGGTLTVKSVSLTGTLTVNGHVVSGNSSGSTAAAAPGLNSCTGGASTVSLASGSNDTAGTIIVTTSSGTCSAGALGTINFANSYGLTPRVIISGQDAHSTSLQAFPTSKSASAFSVSTAIAPSPSTTYTYDYFVVE